MHWERPNPNIKTLSLSSPLSNKLNEAVTQEETTTTKKKESEFSFPTTKKKKKTQKKLERRKEEIDDYEKGIVSLLIRCMRLAFPWISLSSLA